MLAVAALGVFISLPSAISDVRAYRAAPPCREGATPAADCVGMGTATVVSASTSGGRSRTYTLELALAGPGTVGVDVGSDLWNAVPVGGSVGVETWHGQVVAVSYGGLRDETGASPTTTASLRLVLAWLLPLGAAFLAGAILVSRRRAHELSVAPDLSRPAVYRVAPTLPAKLAITAMAWVPAGAVALAVAVRYPVAALIVAAAGVAVSGAILAAFMRRRVTLSRDGVTVQGWRGEPTTVRWSQVGGIGWVRRSRGRSRVIAIHGEKPIRLSALTFGTAANQGLLAAVETHSARQRAEADERRLRGLRGGA